MLHLHGPQTLLGLAGEHPQQRSEGVRRGFVGAGDGVEGDREGRAQWADRGAVRVGAEGGEGIDQRQARDIARSNFDLAMRRYGEGVGSYLDALSVQQQLLVAERQLASLESQQIDLSVQLVQALGGGFQPDSRSAALATAKAPAE